MDLKTVTRTLVASRSRLLTVAVVGAALLLPAAGAKAQVVYSSLVAPILPAQQFQFSAGPGIFFAVDDYTTTLAGSQPLFRLGTLTFVGGVEFTGAANGTNNVLQFRFLDQFGSEPTPLTVQQFAFAVSGTNTYMLDFGGALIPTQGVIEITTLPGGGATGGTLAQSTGVQVGANNAGNQGIRAFQFAAAAAPEPATFGLLALGLTGTALAARRRTR